MSAKVRLVLYFLTLVFWTPLVCAQEMHPYTIDDTEHHFAIYKSFDQFEKILKTESDSIFIINFWATWCRPCVAELPYFESLTQKYEGEKVKVVLVSLDFPRKLEKKLIPFLQKNKLKSEVILLADPKEQEWIDRVDENWSGAIPITLFFNKDKRLFLEQDFHDFNALEQAFLNFKKS